MHAKSIELFARARKTIPLAPPRVCQPRRLLETPDERLSDRAKSMKLFAILFVNACSESGAFVAVTSRLISASPVALVYWPDDLRGSIGSDTGDG